MIHIGTVMRVLGERKTFIGNHPDFLSFILQVFGGELEPGTVLEVRVTRPKRDMGDGAANESETKRALVELRASDMDFFQGMRQLVKEIVKE